MPTKTPTPTKAPAKRPAKKTAAPAPTATVNGDTAEPLIRIAFSADDLTMLVAHIGGWDNAVAHRLRMRLAKHHERWG